MSATHRPFWIIVLGSLLAGASMVRGSELGSTGALVAAPTSRVHPVSYERHRAACCPSPSTATTSPGVPGTTLTILPPTSALAAPTSETSSPAGASNLPPTAPAVVEAAPGTIAPTFPTVTAAASAGPLLIKHGWDIPTPDFVRDHVATMEQRGFDGVVTTLGELSGRIDTSTPVGYAELRAALEPIAQTTFTTMTHNFVIMYAGTPDFYGDRTIARQNHANLARAAREVGLEGIVYDNEGYEGQWEWPARTPGHTLADAREQARLRGADLMASMLAEWPDLTFMALVGPWQSDPATAAHLGATIPFNDVSWANELLGPHVVGMFGAAVGTSATIVDGGEIYTIRSAEQYQTAYDWLTTGMAQSTLVPASWQAAYPAAVDVAFGVYDRPWMGVPMDATVWRTTLARALQRTDGYVWAYTEQHDWWGVGWPATAVPQDWASAAFDAKALADGPPDAYVPAPSRLPASATPTAVDPSVVDVPLLR